METQYTINGNGHDKSKADIVDAFIKHPARKRPNKRAADRRFRNAIKFARRYLDKFEFNSSLYGMQIPGTDRRYYVARYECSVKPQIRESNAPVLGRYHNKDGRIRYTFQIAFDLAGDACDFIYLVKSDDSVRTYRNRDEITDICEKLVEKEKLRLEAENKKRKLASFKPTLDEKIGQEPKKF